MPARYLVLWVQPGKSRQDDVIIACDPFLKDENTARAVLDSHEHKNYAGMILLGDERKLSHCLNAIDEQDDGWETSKIFENIEALAKEYDCSVLGDRDESEASRYYTHRPEGPSNPPPKEGLLDWDLSDEDEEEQYLEYQKDLVEKYQQPKQKQEKSVANVVTATRKLKPGTYPIGITDAGKDLWDKILVSYKNDLKKYAKKPEMQWALALYIFRKEAAKQGIPTFNKSPKDLARTAMLKDLVKTVERYYNTGIGSLTSSHKALQEAGIGSRLCKPKFHETKQSQGMYYMIFACTSRTKKGFNFKSLAEMGYTVTKEWAHKKIDKNVYTMWEDISGKSSVIAYTKIGLTKDQALALLGQGDKLNNSDILTGLATVARRWTRTNKLTVASLFSDIEDLLL